MKNCLSIKHILESHKDAINPTVYLNLEHHLHSEKNHSKYVKAKVHKKICTISYSMTRKTDRKMLDCNFQSPRNGQQLRYQMTTNLSSLTISRSYAQGCISGTAPIRFTRYILHVKEKMPKDLRPCPI